MLHIHLDPLGGIAGDMFAAAMLDAFPAHREAVLRNIHVLAGTQCRLIEHGDGVLTGLRFRVDDTRAAHEHRSWRDIHAALAATNLPDAVRGHAIGIFAGLAAAEAQVHGCTPEDVTFHEVGAADSIADIVAAATLIAAIGPATWSVGPLPLGSGRVDTAHGPMPVPAPATARLLKGFAMLDDGIPGERVTPTGAAILRYLAPGARPPGVLRHAGHGFGMRRLNGISNCLRVLVLETPVEAGHRSLGVISFEVDDQSGEDLATGIDRLRAMEGVHDVIQMAAFGKKNRLAVHVQVLVRPAALDEVVAACFRETTTIGLRTHLVEGRALPRRFAEVSAGGQPVSVKLVERPGGRVTGKAESDHLAAAGDHATRSMLRREAEMLAERA